MLSTALSHLQSGEPVTLTKDEREAVIKLGEAAITVTTDIDGLLHQFPNLTLEQAEEVVRLVLTHQVHTCTHSCTEDFAEGQKCRHFYPRPPSLFTLLATTPDLKTPGAKDRLETVEAMVENLQGLLRVQPGIGNPGGEVQHPALALVTLLHQVADPPVPLGRGYYSWAGVVQGPGEELEELLLRCGAHGVGPDDALLLALYHCLLLTRRHPKLLLVRQVNESFIVNTNPWVLLAWEANMEIEIITHTPSTLYSYVSKGGGQSSLNVAITELRQRGSPRDLMAARKLEVAVERGKREVTMAEAMIRMDPRLWLSATSSTGMVSFVNAAQPGTPNSVRERSQEQKAQYSLR